MDNENLTCPQNGDPSNDCEDCAHAPEYHLVDGECEQRTEILNLSDTGEILVPRPTVRAADAGRPRAFTYTGHLATDIVEGYARVRDELVHDLTAHVPLGPDQGNTPHVGEHRGAQGPEGEPLNLNTNITPALEKLIEKKGTKWIKLIKEDVLSFLKENLTEIYGIQHDINLMEDVRDYVEQRRWLVSEAQILLIAERAKQKQDCTVGVWDNIQDAIEYVLGAL